jgi:hypothetical protein
MNSDNRTTKSDAIANQATASSHLLALARRTAAAYLAHAHPRAIMLSGSAAEGQSDFYSDLDTILYYDELPWEEALFAARQQNNGSERNWLIGDRSEGEIAESYNVDGVECQFAHTTIATWEKTIVSIMDQLEVATPNQKAMSGLLHGIPLYGEELIRQWQARVAHYPDALAQAMVEKYLTFSPIWYNRQRYLTRDATLWLNQMLVESSQNILGVLAGLNRLYYSTFQFKRTRLFVDQMRIKPDDLADRLDDLFRLDAEAAIDQLESLVSDTVTLVEKHMPHIDTSKVRQKLGQRQPRWTPP